MSAQPLSNYQQLVIALIQPFNELEAVFQSIMTMRQLAVATGWLEDLIGKLVGQARNGLSDDDYRRYLYARVATNKSTGRPGELINICQLILNDPTNKIHILNYGYNGAHIRIEEGSIPAPNIADALESFLKAAAGAGIRIVLETPTATDAESFAFGLQTFSTGGLSAGNTSIPVTSTAGFPFSGTLQLDSGLSVQEDVTYSGISPTAFLGIPATGSGSIANSHGSGAEVQSIDDSPGAGFGSCTTTTAIVNPAATSIPVTSTAGFPSSGSLLLDAGLPTEETVTYTGTSGGNTFTGVPASGSGSVANTHASGAEVQDPAIGGAMADARD